MSLSACVDAAGIRYSADFASDPLIEWITADTRDLRPGSLFVCMPSPNRDTHQFLEEASQNGAVACVVYRPEAATIAQNLGLAVIGIVDEGQAFNFAVGRLCRAFFGDPSNNLTVVGITGTNGKTTTAWMVRNALVEMGVQTAYLGTLGFQTTGEIRTLENTTPFPVELWQLLNEAEFAGCEVVVMEASSHALYQRRLAGVSFDVGVFTNLTQDHLDFHGSMSAYEQAKRLLFTEYAAGSKKDFVACLNMSDPVSREWVSDLPCPVYSFGPESAMLATQGKDVQVDGLTLSDSQGHSARLKFGGAYNIENATAAWSTLIALGYDVEESLQALASVDPVPGRFEAVPNDLGIGVLVDYAHTPDALENLLRSVRPLTSGQVITVFGCGGDRDRNKRPKMAAAASSLSDLTIVTSDNPRTEDPAAILAEVQGGIVPGANSEAVIERPLAIQRAIGLAVPGDIVVIAGKGHEDYQIIGREKFHMSDREMAKSALIEKARVTQ